VVGVISDRVDALEPDPGPHAQHATTTAAATVAAEAVATIDRVGPNCTRLTLTSTPARAGAPKRPADAGEAFTTVCRTRPAANLIEG
jgi:hypothetical protein